MTTIIAKRLRELRESAGKTQEEIADMLKIRRQTYNAYEQGKIMPKPENLIKISQIFSTTPNYLLGFDDKRFPDTIRRSTDNTAVGGVIRRLREEKNLTLTEVATEFNIPLKTLKEYEDGAKEIPQNIIESFAKYFDVEIDRIIALEIGVNKKHAFVTTSEELSRRYQKWQNVIGYNTHFTDSEIDEIISFAKYIQWRRNGHERK